LRQRFANKIANRSANRDKRWRSQFLVRPERLSTRSHIKDFAKLDDIRFELALLRLLKADCGYGGEGLEKLEAELKATNFLLWNVENELREHEVRGDFGADFVSLARQIYKTNDQRADLKNKINALFSTQIRCTRRDNVRSRHGG
jgi:hypothetical protein